jgi:CHAT domain-containing protein
VDDNWNSWRGRARSPQTISDASFVFELLCHLKSARYIVESSMNSPALFQVPLKLDSLAKRCSDHRSAALASGKGGRAAYAAWCEAEICRRGRDYGNASALLEQARSLYESADDQVGVGLCTMTAADWLCAPAGAPTGWNFSCQENIASATNISFRFPPVWPDRQTIDKCRNLYSAAENSFREAGARRGLAAVQLRGSYLAFLDGDTLAAMGCAKSAINGFTACGDERGRAIACMHLVMARIVAGHPHGAGELFGSIGSWAEVHGSLSFNLGLGFTLSEFGRYWLHDEGDGERAAAAFAAAEVLHGAIGASASAAQAAADQGSVFETIGELSAALVFFERALDLYVLAIQSSPAKANVLQSQVTTLASSVFNLYVAQMDGAGIKRSAHRLSELTGIRPLGKIKITGQFHQTLPHAFALQDKPVEMSIGPGGIGEKWPIAIGEKSDQLLESFYSRLVHQAEEYASVLSPLYRARAARDEGKDDEADRLMAHATAALQELPPSQMYYMQSLVLAEQKRFKEAAVAFRQHIEAILAAHPSQETKGSTGLLVKQQQRQDHDLAFTTFTRFKAYEEAKVHFEALRQMGGDTWWAASSKPWLSLSDCGEMYEGLNELDLAVLYYDKAIGELEARRSQLNRNELRTALSGNKGSQFLYFQSCRTLFKKGDDHSAFLYAERGKARALLDLMAGSDLSSLTGDVADTIRSWRRLTAQVTLRRGLLAQEYGRGTMNTAHVEELQQALAADEARLVETELELSRSNPRFPELIAKDAKILAIDDVAGTLQANTLLLEYLFLGEDMLAWAIDDSGLVAKLRMPVDARALARDIRTFHAACAAGTAADSQARALAEIFIEPFAGAIDGASHLIIVPYGAAHQLPFHALPFAGEPLSTRRSVSYLPNASSLQFLQRQDVELRVDHMLAVGNPTGDLPAAAIEASCVASLFNEQALTGVAATKAVVRERIRGTPLLHFATHANLFETEPLRSSIILANGEELTVYELMGLQLDAEIVVLSACDTGRGAISGGDDVVGLTRGLLAAGARSAVVSLWPVEDVSTSLLMGAFYGRLIQRKGAAAAALAEAQSWLRKSTAAELGLANRYEQMMAVVDGKKGDAFWRMRYFRTHPDEKPFTHPYYWAGFSYVGI